MNSPIRHRLSPSQMEALGEIARLREQGKIELFEKVPASEYIDPARFELEMKAFFEREPVLIGPSCLLPKPNSYMQIDLMGMPVLLTRDKQGVARAFANVCMHRGTVLCPSDKVEEGSRLVCPYHAWTYALDGQLIGVPREDVFPGIDKSKYHLVELPSAEAGGLIWVGPKPRTKIDFSAVTGDLASDLDGLGMADMHIYFKKTYPLKANWKLVQDTMLDTYHVTRLHRESVGKFFLDLPEVSQMIGPHVRSASGRAGFKQEDINEDFAVARRRSVFGYALYPAGAIVVSPRYTSLCIMRPVAVDRTDTDFYMLVTDMPEDDASKAKLEESVVLMEKAFGEEDFWAAELGHKGLASGVLDDILIGGSEHRVHMFREVLQDKLLKYQRGLASNE